jgi:hypothetical protein
VTLLPGMNSGALSSSYADGGIPAVFSTAWRRAGAVQPDGTAACQDLLEADDAPIIKLINWCSCRPFGKGPGYPSGLSRTVLVRFRVDGY